MSNHTNFSSGKGQTLIEVLVALGVSVLIVSAISAAILSALSNAQYSKNQNTATQYAQEGMEIVRNFRNSDLTAFSALLGNPNEQKSYCLDKGFTTIDKENNVRNNLIAGCSGTNNISPKGQNVDIFARQVTLEKSGGSCGNNVTKVTVFVSWSDSKCASTQNIFCHKVQIISCLSETGLVGAP